MRKHNTNNVNPLKSLAKKYTKMSEPKPGYSRDIRLKTPFTTKDGNTVVAFYTHKNNIFCITDDEWDIDPRGHFTPEEMNRFCNYISNEENVSI